MKFVIVLILLLDLPLSSFLKLWLATRFTDMSKHNYYDHQNAYNRIHSTLFKSGAPVKHHAALKLIKGVKTWP